MNKSDEFYDKVEEALYIQPVLKWPSESDQLLLPVALTWWKTLRWEAEKIPMNTLTAVNRLPEVNQSASWHKLLMLFWDTRGLTVYRRNTNGDATVDLYVLKSFGWWKVGFKTKLIET